MNIAIDVKQMDHQDHVHVGGEIDAYTAPKLREVLFPLSEKKGVHLIVDLGNVSYMDSTGLGVFVGVFKNVRSNDGNLMLVGLSERLRRLFTITGLADIMNIESHTEGEVQ
ncbi:anti-sigma factor antagonist RsbV [Bacillus carboniphilus]|uniref:Anti-sigma factor antagonist n=1 Tax=Bacillus carboniphilus TaxID=86663 RepID=A0ABP3FRH6_9BACI